MDLCDTGHGGGPPVGPDGLQVPVGKGQEPPGHGEQHPGAKEGGGEDQQRVLPLEVHHGGENILQEAALEEERASQ